MVRGNSQPVVVFTSARVQRREMDSMPEGAILLSLPAESMTVSFRGCGSSVEASSHWVVQAKVRKW